MASQTLLWIAVPNGVTTDDGSGRRRGRLSVVIVPRLQPDADNTLAPFDLLDWPSCLTPDRFRIEIGVDGRRLPATIVSRPESRRWRSLFGPATFVRPFQTDIPSGVISSFHAAQLHDRVKQLYQDVAVATPFTRASSGVVADLTRDLAEPLREIAVEEESTRTGRLTALVDRALDDARRSRSDSGFPAFTPLVPASDTRGEPFASFIAFHQQPSGSIKTARVAGDARLDFHQRVSALGEYPAVLRLLGLILDVEIEAGVLPEATASAPGRVRVVPTFLTPLGVETTSIAPATAYVHQAGRIFTAASRQAVDGELVSGLVNLRQPVSAESPESQYQIIQTDVDTAGMRMLDLVRNADAAPGLHALRTTGLSIVRHQQAEHLHEAMRDGFETLVAASADPESAPLFAETLLRGWRVDVRDQTSRRWRSLHQREGALIFPGEGATLTISDEGCAQPAIAQPTSGSGPAPSTIDGSQPNFVSESLFLWHGWSLAVPQPVMSLPEPARLPDAPVPPEPEMGPPLEALFAATPRSLPRLRFGERYHMRLRAVDLAGNGLSLAEADQVVDALETGDGPPPPVLPASPEGFRCLRFEPIASPVMALGADTNPREAIDHLVLRSNHDVIPEEYVSRQPRYRHAAERLIVPPTSSQWMAETLGLFDASIGTGRGFEDTYARASREKGAGGRSGLPDLPDPMAAGAAFRGLPGVPRGSVGRIRDGRLTFERAPILDDVRDDVDEVVLIDFGPAEEWPNARPFRLHLTEGSGEPEWDDAGRVLTVSMPKATSASVRLSCYLPDDRSLEQLGLWSWMNDRLEEQLHAGLLTEAEAAARRERWKHFSLLGCSWLLTPYRELTLTHAVQQPIDEPAVLGFGPPVRLSNRTSAFIGGGVRIHAASTASLDLAARWTEIVDDGVSPRPTKIACATPVFDFPLSSASSAPVLPGSPDPIPAMTWDAERAIVSYRAPATAASDAEIKSLARSLENEIERLRRALAPLSETSDLKIFGNEVVVGFDDITSRVPIDQQWAKWDLPMSQIVFAVRQLRERIPPVPPELRIPPEIERLLLTIRNLAEKIATKAAELLRHVARFQSPQEFHDTRFRRVTYRLIATSTSGEHFRVDPDESPLSTSRETEVDVDVLSSAAPPPLEVEAVVPAFFWTRSPAPEPGSESEAEVRHQRGGGGIRIYLRRPWFSSGDGELLGVVLGPPPTSDAFPPMARFVSQWGRDPIWQSAPLPDTLRPEHFRTPGLVRTNVQLQEPEINRHVTIVGFPVDFDDEGRCFCDLRLDSGASYFPFVRLALVRFQPNSIEGVELSPVALADFVQLAPDRSVTILPRPDALCDVTVSGRTHASSFAPPGDGGPHGTQVRLSLFRRIAGTTDEVGWLPLDEAAPIEATPEIVDGVTFWKATVPKPATDGVAALRLLIEEVETYRAFTEAGSETMTDRVVFADTVDLPQ